MRAALLALTVALSMPRPAHAQAIPRRAIERGARSAVHLITVDGDGGTYAGSGAIIHASGLILTNFHVVGHTTGPLAGLLHSRDALVGVVESSRHRLEHRYVARVVAGDARRDLALLRIVSEVGGGNAAGPFPAVRVSRSQRRLTPGSPVAAIGFPAGVRTVEVTGGQVTGVELDAHGETAWLRTDTRLNPGNSGGLLIDRRGRLVGIPTAIRTDTTEPIEMAIATEQIPGDWLSGDAVATLARVVGVPWLVLGSPYQEIADGSALPTTTGSDEVLYFRFPPTDSELVITTTPPLQLLVEGVGGGRVSGHGRVVVEPNLAERGGAVAVLTRNSRERALPFRILAERQARPLSPEEIATVISERRSQIRSCWFDLDGEYRRREVRLEVSFSVSGDGRVRNLRVDGGPDALRRCAHRSVRAWRFPALGETTDISIPFIFRQKRRLKAPREPLGPSTTRSRTRLMRISRRRLRSWPSGPFAR